ncbi:MAG: hypothetical protein GQ533_03485 [Methanosarcinaceae archaeon]|nr:hypothetical protein [Methanosarcinaceae archaeon]
MPEKNNDFWWGILIGTLGTAIVYSLSKMERRISPIEEMRNIINNSQRDSSIRKAVATITQNCTSEDSICEISNIFSYVTDKIKYMRDPKRKDYFAHPLETLELKIGDCDCKSILLASLFESIGHETRLALIPGHVFVEVGIDTNDISKLPKKAFYIPENGRVWVPLESTAKGAYVGWMGKTNYDATVKGNVRYG